MRPQPVEDPLFPWESVSLIGLIAYGVLSSPTRCGSEVWLLAPSLWLPSWHTILPSGMPEIILRKGPVHADEHSWAAMQCEPGRVNLKVHLWLTAPMAGVWGQTDYTRRSGWFQTALPP